MQAKTRGHPWQFSLPHPISNPLGNLSMCIYPESTIGHSKKTRDKATAMIPLMRVRSCFYSLFHFNILSMQHAVILLKLKTDPITPLLKTTFPTAYKALNNPVFIIFPWSLLLSPPPSLYSCYPGCFDVSQTCQANTPASKPFHLLFSLPETFFPQMSALFTISPLNVSSKGKGSFGSDLFTAVSPA